MGRTLALAGIIAELEKRIETCENNKQKLLAYVQQIKNKCINREITYSEYEDLLNEKRQGKTIQEWLDFYDSYIEQCEQKIRQEKRKSITKKVLTAFLSFSFIFILLFSAFYLRPVIVGLIVKEKPQEFTETLNLELTEPTQHEWQLAHLGQLQSVKISGLIKGDGEIKVYLDDLLILDSNKIKAEETKLTGSAITGLFAGEAEESLIQEPEAVEEEVPAEEQAGEESYSEEQEEAPQEQEESPSQEEPLASETEQETITEPAEEIPTETEVTTPGEVEEPEEIPENITEEILENATEEKPIEEEIEITIKKFTDICEETCNIGNLNLNKTSYTLKIEISNAKLNLDEIKYEIIPTEIAEEVEIPENITPIIPENITPEINVTIPENITILPEINATITTTQQQARLGEPVKWKKNVKLEKQGLVKVELPELAENISVIKLREHIEEAKEEITEEKAEITEAKPETEEELERVTKRLEELEKEIKEIKGKLEEKATTEKETIAEEIEKENPTITGKASFTITKPEEKGQGLLKKIFSTITGRAITTEEIPEEGIIEVIIDDTAVEYEVAYETPAPIAIEENISESRKKVKITSQENLSYSNIISYTTILELVKIEDKNKIKIYWLENNEYIEFNASDTDDNGFIDYIEWISPSTESTFEISITILNIHSYPSLYGNWTVEFETTGTADLKITATSDPTYTSEITRWSNESENNDLYDLKFIEIRCGNEIKKYEWEGTNCFENECSVFISNYSCNETAKEISKVLTAKKHVLKFNFGGIEAYAYNQIYATSSAQASTDFPTPAACPAGSLDVDDTSYCGDTLSIDGDEWGYVNSTHSSDIPSGSTISNVTICSRFSITSKIGDNTGDYVKVYGCQNSTSTWACTQVDVCTGITSGCFQAEATRCYDLTATMNTAEKAKDIDIRIYVYGADNDNNQYPIVDLNYVNITYIAPDNTKPIITIKYPTNASYNYDVNILNYTYTEANLDKCWYHNITGINSTFASLGANFTSVISVEGSNTYTVWCNDTSSNKNSTSVMFVKDTANPKITISYPTNTTYSSSYIDFNLTSDQALNFCNFSIGTVNYTMTISGIKANYTNSSMSSGQYTARFWCNDSAGNINNTEAVTFLIDTIKPILTIYMPQNTSYANQSTLINFTANEYNTLWFYNGTSNTTYTTPLHQNFTDGQYAFIFYANDSANNMNSTSKTFLIDTIKPILAIKYPTNTTYNYDVNMLNYTYTEANLDKCWYHNITGINSTTVTAGTNWTDVVISVEGSNKWTVWCNDTAGNENSTSIMFAKDTTPPKITINYPANSTYSASYIDFNVSSDKTLSLCNFSLLSNYSMSLNATPTAANYTNSSVNDGQYKSIFWCEDILGNVNNTESVTFLIDTVKPILTVYMPQNATYNNQSTLINFTANEYNTLWFYNGSTNTTYTTTLHQNHSDGQYTFIFYANDTAGNKNSTPITFLINTTKPILTIYMPQNTSYANQSTLINFTADSYNTLWFYNGSANTTYITPLHQNFTDGQYAFIFYANNSAGNKNSTSLTFLIDTIKPILAIKYPTNTTYNYDVNMLNYTYTEANLDKCWYHNITGINSTFASLGANFTSVISVEGSNTYTVWCNDTSSNKNSTSIMFAKDTTAPSVFLIAPTNATTTRTSTVWFAANFTDNMALKNATLYIWNSTLDLINNTENRTIIGIENSTNISVTLPYLNTFYWNYYVCDSSNNCAFNTSNFTLIYWKPSRIGLTLVYPTFNITANQNQLFNVTVNISCFDADCGEVNVSLDPASTTLYYPNSTKADGWKGLDADLPPSALADLKDTAYTAAERNTTSLDDGNSVSQTGDEINYPGHLFLFNITESVATINNISIRLATIGAESDPTSYLLGWNHTAGNFFTMNSSVCSFQGQAIMCNLTYVIKDPINFVNASGDLYIATQLSPASPPRDSTVYYVEAKVDYTPTPASGKTGLVSTTAGETPFYTNESNPRNISLDVNQDKIVTFWVNATGTVGNSYEFFVYANKTSNMTISNISKKWNVTIEEVTNTPPQVSYVWNYTMTGSGDGIDPSEAGYVNVSFNVTVTDSDGYENINDASIEANFTRTGEAIRKNSTCAPIANENTDTSQNFSCNIEMWYFDEAGSWNITVYAEDDSAVSAINETSIFTYKQLQSIVISPNQISFDVAIGAKNQTSTINTTINNTGNYPVTAENIQIMGRQLHGATTDSEYIAAGNFSVFPITGGTPPLECNNTNTLLTNGTFVGIVMANLSRGNLSLGGGTAQENLYYCLRQVPSTISSQTYSTTLAGSWTIKILIAVFIFTPQVKKKGRKRKVKVAKDDKLIKAFNLIADELKQEYSLNKKELIEIIIEKLREKYKISKKEISELIKSELNIPATIFSKELGALESLTKYMKENSNLSYKEIADLLNRDERTIWTAYNKAKKKKPEALEIKETGIIIPVSIFKDKRLTILESIVIYLKQKQMKYIEIAKLLNRDQRNIWTIYSRAVKKLRRKV